MHGVQNYRDQDVHCPITFVQPPGLTCNRYQDSLRSSCVLTSRVPPPMMASPRLQLHTEEDSEQSACDVRNGHSAGKYKPAHLNCLVGI
ncbi:hypothetical protein DPMN_110660 [Dreissena polymorpha]|uniref:Uncharacterized protein n=1 Tax=Dreissena polymorpha TaxID=45954 RepID=A0A9D4KCF3_DREPO|nr:hypothetical protein DPMN_110660 [Dreissena polymorpha]